ncbi:MAG TPA: M20/M25/M40 family metallo-hydrolase [Bacteroidota bacterium]|nr:M20/M25/M40 family metallo-hydrolase [Bacteroidota bacterium]
MLPLFCVVLLLQALPGRVSAGVDSTDLRRIITFLAGDGLKGRGSFTPESETAAGFIAGEFRQAGLSPLPGEASLEIRFPVNRRTAISTSATLNGAVVPDTEVIVSTGETAVTMAGIDSLPVFRMGEKFDRSLMRRKTGLILIPRSYEKMFARYRRFSAAPRLFTGEPEPGVLVAILTDRDSVDSFSLTYRAAADTRSLVNVVGMLPGKRGGETVLFSAHYDHLGVVTPVGGDSIANGANDDASGTTAVIALAKDFASGETPERTLIFAAFAAEEIGGFGSRSLAGELDPATIVAMVNLEMVGTVSKFGPRSFWITGYEKSDFGPIVAGELTGTGYSAHPDPYPDQNLFSRSDNATFARKGVPAHSVSTDPIDVDSVYHTVADEIGRIDIGHLSEIVRGVELGVRGIVDGRQTPTRIAVDGN